MKIQPAPKFLPDVLQAIGDLNETGGSSARKIVSRLLDNESNISCSDLRNLTVQVRRALNHATASGLVFQRAGKFRINKQILDPRRDCEECRRREKRLKGGRKKRKSKGRRKHNRGVKESHGPFLDSEESDEDNDFPVRQLKRRSRGRRKGGAAKKSRRRRKKKEQVDIVQKRPSSHRSEANSAMVEDMRKDVFYPDDVQEGEGPVTPSHNDVQCDNPDCLCNVQENAEEVENLDSSN